jgi:hypothetical protein
MPEHWTPSERGESSTRSVPLKFCRKAILGLSHGEVLNTDADVSFMLQYNGDIRIVTRSLSIDKFGWLVKNKKILVNIQEYGGFQKTGSSWVGSFDNSDLDEIIEVIYQEKSCNAQLSASQVKLIQGDIVRTEVKPKERIDLPIENQQSFIPKNEGKTDKSRRLRIAKAKAKAKLKILNLLNL